MAKKQVFIAVEGDKVLENMLNRLETNLKKKALRKATRESARVVQAHAKALAPVDSGQLKKAIRVRSKRRSRKPTIGHQVWVGDKWFKGDQFYAAFVEFGTKERFTKTTGRARTRTEQSRPRGKMKPRPFLRPAAMRSKAQAIKLFRDALERAVKDITYYGKIQRRKSTRIKVS